MSGETILSGLILLVLLTPVLICAVGILYDKWRVSLTRRQIAFVLKGVEYMILRKTSLRALQLRKELSREASQISAARRS